MAKKLSTLIIDAVINTSQIDQAANRINQKLGGVGGRAGRGGYGGPSGGPFTGGGTPYGYAAGGGGVGSAAGGAMAAAFGAGAGAVAATRMANLRWGSDSNKDMRSFSRQKQKVSNQYEEFAYRDYAKAYRNVDKARAANAKNPHFLNQANLMDAEIALEQEAEHYGREKRRTAEANRLYASHQRGARKRAAMALPGRMAGAVSAGIEQAAGGIGSIASMAAVPLAIDRINQAQANLDEYNYIGNSARFNAAKAARERFEGGAKPLGYLEAFALGMNTGGGSYLSNIIEKVDQFGKAVVAGIGSGGNMMAIGGGDRIWNLVTTSNKRNTI
jgi:hypothetical protein